MTHTVLIADDSEIVRNAIRKVLAREPSIEIVARFQDNFLAATIPQHRRQ
jgi:DNA-binding NarL/FixJ family response regulator